VKLHHIRIQIPEEETLLGKKIKTKGRKLVTTCTSREIKVVLKGTADRFQIAASPWGREKTFPKPISSKHYLLNAQGQ